MYLFSRKIKCNLCGGNFRGITERGIKKYYCSTYHNYRTCVRYKVGEDELIKLIVNHLEIQRLKSGIGLGSKRGRGRMKKEQMEREVINLQLISNYVSEIIVDPQEESIKIVYVDNSNTFISPTRQIY